MIFLSLLFFSYFSQADIYGEFILTNEIGVFIPPKFSFSSLLQRKKRLLFLENCNKILLYSEGVFKPLIFDAQGNYLGYLETSFYYAKKVKYQKKEMIVIPQGNVLGFYTLKNKGLNLYRKLLLNEYIEDFNFLISRDSFFIVLSCSDEKENKIKIYNQNFKLITEKSLIGKFLIEPLFDTLILGIEKSFKKLVLLNKNLQLLWEFQLKDLVLNDYAVWESLLIMVGSDTNQEQGALYFLSLKKGKIIDTFPFGFFYPFGFSSVKTADIDNDTEKEIILSASGKKGEIIIFKRVKDKLIVKKKRVFQPLNPWINNVNVLILEVDDFIYDKNRNKELILLVTYEEKTNSSLPNNFNSGQIILVDNKLKDIADLDL
ncbi:MAG: hypothetical protein ABIK80_05450, partial [candidate division WOR-3 bacterium]